MGFWTATHSISYCALLARLKRLIKTKINDSNPISQKLAIAYNVVSFSAMFLVLIKSFYKVVDLFMFSVNRLHVFKYCRFLTYSIASVCSAYNFCLNFLTSMFCIIHVAEHRCMQ